MFSTNDSQITDGAGRKYSFQSNTATAISQATRKATPKSTGGQTAARSDGVIHRFLGDAFDEQLVLGHRPDPP